MEVIFIVFSLLEMFRAIFWKMAIFPTTSTAPYFFCLLDLRYVSQTWLKCLTYRLLQLNGTKLDHIK